MKSPQEKKLLSYSKDRRYTYGESNKGARNTIPRAKAHGIRAERHSQDQLLAAAALVRGDDELAAIENSLKATKPRVWKKCADQSLALVLSERIRRKGGDAPVRKSKRSVRSGA